MVIFHGYVSLPEGTIKKPPEIFPRSPGMTLGFVLLSPASFRATSLVQRLHGAQCPAGTWVERWSFFHQICMVYLWFNSGDGLSMVYLVYLSIVIIFFSVSTIDL
jgi:hypothetical protein